MPAGEAVAPGTVPEVVVLSGLDEGVGWLEAEDWITLIDGARLDPGPVHTVTWNGLDPNQAPAPDGAYEFILAASGVTTFGDETEWATVVVDRTPPAVTITSPADGLLTALPVTISGGS